MEEIAIPIAYETSQSFELLESCSNIHKPTRVRCISINSISKPRCKNRYNHRCVEPGNLRSRNRWNRVRAKRSSQRAYQTNIQTSRTNQPPINHSSTDLLPPFYSSINCAIPEERSARLSARRKITEISESLAESSKGFSFGLRCQVGKRPVEREQKRSSLAVC